MVRIFLSSPGRDSRAIAAAAFPRAEPGTGSAVALLARGMGALLAGEAVRLPLELMDIGSCPPFQRRVLVLEHSVPRGGVCSYGMLAEAAGAPAAARAAGRALATNPFPLVVPCHRAVRSDGSTGGFQGGPGMKRALLEMEGVVLEGGRVPPRLFVKGLQGAVRPAPSR